MIDAVLERIERDGITLSTFMRQAVRDALTADPGLSLPVLKVIALRRADNAAFEAFRSQLEAAMDEAFQRFCGSRIEAAVPGAEPSQSGWHVDINVRFFEPGEDRPPALEAA